MKLWLVRHARPLIEPGICYGATDVAADARATADQARRLARLLPAGARIYTSPLQRCESLAAELCRRRPDLAFERDPRLREMDFGGWEGRRWDAIGPDEFEPWMRNFPEHRVGGGDNVRGLMDRVALALQSTREHAASAGDVANAGAVWITHAGVISAARLLMAGVVKIDNPREWRSQAPAYGRWCELEIGVSIPRRKVSAINMRGPSGAEIR